MTKTYGSYTDADLNDWERFPMNANVLTSSAFGAWLWRRDERRDAKVLESKLKQLKANIEEYEADCSLRLDEDDETCKKCDKAQFSSIYRMIDKILEENKTEKEK